MPNKLFTVVCFLAEEMHTPRPKGLKCPKWSKTIAGPSCSRSELPPVTCFVDPRCSTNGALSRWQICGFGETSPDGGLKPQALDESSPSVRYTRVWNRCGTERARAFPDDVAIAAQQKHDKNAQRLSTASSAFDHGRGS
ncbi:hypothetical protein Aduo_005052 [Ancylostoma duodenale]